MTLREFIDFSIIRLAPLYPEAEAKAIAFRLLDYYLEIPSYKYISDPDLPIVPDDRPEQAETGRGRSGAARRTPQGGRFRRKSAGAGPSPRVPAGPEGPRRRYARCAR